MELSLDSLIRSVQDRSAEPLHQLDAASETAAELGDLGDALLNHFVDRCRRAGHTWAEIGTHLGVTRQAAQKRFVDNVAEKMTFDRMTMRARAALERARDAALRLQHNYVGTEHLLLGLFDVEGGIAAKALDQLGVRRGDVEDGVLGRVGRGPQPVEGEPPLTPRAKKAVEEAIVSAVELGHNYIGTEHLLLGLYRGQDGLAKQILVETGASHDDVRSVVIQMLSNYKPS